MDDIEDGSDLVYKFRRRSDRNNIFAYRTSAGRQIPQNAAHNILYEIDERKHQKTFAILQETRAELTNQKLRHALLLYCNPSWKLFVVITLVISYIIDTSLFTFFDARKRPCWGIVLVICLNFIFILDVVAVFGIKYFRKWRVILNIDEPATVAVILDVIIAVPYAFSYLITVKDISYYIHAVPPLAAIIRVYRILTYFYNRSSQAGSNQWTTFLFQYLILFLLSVHTWTCIWYLFSYRSFDIHKLRSSWSAQAVYLPTETETDWYLVCAYWSIMCLTTNALGDLYPVTTPERISALLSILVGFLLTTVVFVGSLTSQFITITTRRSKYVSQLQKVQNHLRLIKMDIKTTNRIIRYYEDLWYEKSGVFKPKLMNLLPYPLQMEICFDLNAVPLYSSMIFRKLPESFLRRLSLAMNHQFYLPGDIVYNHNQNKTFMVCITRGVLELLSDEDDESPMISFSKGTCFGEISLVLNIPARCTVKAATYVECQILDKTEFIKLIITYPELADTIRQDINKRIDRCQNRRKQEIHRTLSLNIYASKDHRKSSIKCLKDKLRYLQGKTEEDLSPDDYLDVNCLNLYVLSEHTKKRNNLFTCINPSFPWILDWDCYLVKYWERYMLCIVFYICLTYPYFIGFLREFPSGIFFYVEIVITTSLIANIVISTMTSAKTKKKHIKTFRNILRYRLSTFGFYMDLIAIIPFHNLVAIHKSAVYRDNYRLHLYYLCKGSRLCMVWRLSNFFEKLEKQILLNTIIIKIAKYCVYFTLLCYWCGVILFMESCFISRCLECSWFSKSLMLTDDVNGVEARKTEYPFVASIYFATTILLSIGYGDFSPGDGVDMILVAFLSLYGVLLVGYFVAEFSAVVTHWSRNKTSFLEVIYTVDNFMKEHNMHRTIKSRIMAFYELQWIYNSGVELTGQNWLDNPVVPLELRKKVLHQARFKTLTSTKFFQVKNNAFIHTLTQLARDIILPPGEIVYYGGTVSRELYIIESGYCLITNNDMRDTKEERIFGPGYELGLLVLLYGVPAPRTVITLTHCKLISISYSSYTSALSLFPEMKEHEGLLTPEELKVLETDGKTQNAEVYLQHYIHLLMKNKKVKITNFFQFLFNNCFINVYNKYKKNNESYLKSFKEFGFLRNLAPYLLMPIVIKPDGIFIKSWSIIRICTAYLLCFLIPVIISMAPFSHVFTIPINILDAICFIDMYLMLHVAYYGSKNQLIYHPYLTARNYLKGAFFLDFITCFPWYTLWTIVAPKHDEDHTIKDHHVNSHLYHCMFRITNIFQIYKLYAVFWAQSLGGLKRAYLMSVLQFLLLTLFFLNLYTSSLITLSCRCVIADDETDFQKIIEQLTLKGPYMKTTYNSNGNMICQLGSWIDKSNMISDQYLSPKKVYLLALYWSATSFSGAGFGDITAQDKTHMILSICVTVHGALFFGYVYARIASLKAMADQVLTKFQENLKHLEMFMNREEVALPLKKMITEYYKYRWKRTGGWSHQSILGKLHANLNEDAVLYMYEKTLKEIPLFENVEYSFFRALAKMLTEAYFQKGFMIMRCNEVISNIFIIYRGKVDILSDINEVEVCMGPGGIFGNIRGTSKYLTMSNIIASRNIDLLSIEGTEFYALLKSYPAVMRKVLHSVTKASKDYVMPTVISDENSLLSSYPVSYETGEDDDDEIDASTCIESPEKSIADSHGSKSITSGGNADYVKASLLLFLPHKWFRRSVVPDCMWVSFIDYFILVLSYVDFMALVYQMVFMSIPYFFYICVFSDIMFIYKLFLDIHTGYMNRYGEYVLTPHKVRKMYFSKILQRRRDFLANLLVCYVAFALDLKQPMQMALFCSLRTPQLIRITYLFKYRIHGKMNITSGNLLLKLTTIGIWASILSHVNACLFFKLSCLTDEHCKSANWMSKSELKLHENYIEGDYFSLYIAALWYTINLLTITGTGDVTAQNSYEVIETIIVIVIIKFCTGLLISEMSAMITAHSSSRIEYDYGINKLKDGLRDTNLSDHQMNKMWDYVRELWNRQQGKQMPELIHQLPFRLHCQVMQAVYGSHIRDSVIFKRTSDDFKRMLSMWMKHCVFFPGNYIVQCGNSDQCIYFIHRGEVEVLTVHANLTESIYDVLGPNDSFGIAQGLFVGVVHHFSFRARTVVDVVYLKLDEWKYLLDFYPKSAKIIRKKVENVYLAI